VSRTGKTGSSGDKNCSNHANELAELREATRQAHEVLRDIKVERKKLLDDKRSLEFTKTLVEAATKEAKDFIEGEVSIVLAQAITNHLAAAKEAFNESIESMSNTILEFREAKDIVLERAARELNNEVDAVRELVRKRQRGNPTVGREVIVDSEDTTHKSSRGTFSNG